MRNVMQKQEDLKGLSQQQLVKEMQMPSGQFEQFLVLTELGRRKRMTDDQARREAADDTNTVAQEVVNAAGVPQGGIAQLASAMNAKTDNTQNTGVKQMAEGGVVKAQPGGMLSNIMSLMNPYSLKNITDYNPTVLKEPKMTGLEAMETISPEVEAALEISKRAEEGEVNINLINKLYGNTKKFADFLAGSIGILGYEGTRATLETVARFTPDINTRKDILRLADSVEERRNDFIRDGTLAYSNAFMEQGMTEEEAKAAAEAKVKKEIEESSIAAINKADTYDAFGDKPVTSLFAEGTPSEFLKGTPTGSIKPLPVGPKDSFDAFGNPVHSMFTSGFPRKLNQVGSPKTDAPVGFTTGQRIAPGADVFPAGPGVEAAPVSASRPSVAEEISRLGRPIQTSMTQPPAINTEGDSDDTLFTNVSRADEPFKLGGKALEEAEAKKAAQIKELLASEATDLPFSYGPEEMSMITHPRAKAKIKEGDVYRPDLNNELAMIRAGLTPKTDLEALNFGDRFLGSKRSFDEFGDPKIVNESPFSVRGLIANEPIGQLPNYGDAMADVSGRAADYFKDARLGRLNQSPEEVYGDLEALKTDPKFREEPQALQEYFRQTLENQQKAMPGGGGSSGLGALFAQTLENQQEGIPGGTDPNAKPTLQSRFDRAKLYLEGLGEDIRGLSKEDVIEFAKKAGAKGLDVLDQVTDFGAEKINEFQEFQRNRKDENAARLREENLSPSDPEKTSENTEVNELIEMLKTQQAATAKQSGASSAALSEYLGGLEKDREFDKAMALANAGAALMMPSATIGEGLGKAIKSGTSTLQKGKNSYNKNKLQVLALQGRIDAAKAAAASRSAVTGATLSSRILLSQREALQKQLEIIAPMGIAPDGRAADKADELKRQIKEKDDQLNAMIMSASLGSTPTGSDIFASYNLTS